MTSLLTPDNNVYFLRKGQKGIRSLDTYRRAQQLTIKVVGDRADRKARGTLIAFNVEGLAYEVTDPRQLREIISRLDAAYRMMTGSGEAKVISFGNEANTDSYLYNTLSLGPAAPVGERHA